MHFAATRKKRLVNYAPSLKIVRGWAKKLLLKSPWHTSIDSIISDEYARVQMFEDTASYRHEVFQISFCLIRWRNRECQVFEKVADKSNKHRHIRPSGVGKWLCNLLKYRVFRLLVKWFEWFSLLDSFKNHLHPIWDERQLKMEARTSYNTRDRCFQAGHPLPPSWKKSNLQQGCHSAIVSSQIGCVYESN